MWATRGGAYSARRLRRAAGAGMAEHFLPIPVAVSDRDVRVILNFGFPPGMILPVARDRLGRPNRNLVHGRGRSVGTAALQLLRLAR